MEKKYNVIYMPIAFSDLEEIIEYIQADNPKAAVNMVEKIEENISKLQYFAEVGVQPKDKRLKKLGYRTLIIDNYLVFYVIKGKRVEIRRVIHGMRNYKFLL